MFICACHSNGAAMQLELIVLNKTLAVQHYVERRNKFSHTTAHRREKLECFNVSSLFLSATGNHCKGGA
jgi:hypothetical protein